MRGDPTQTAGKEAMKEPDRRALTAALLRSLRTEFSDTYTPNTHKAYGRAVERFAGFLEDREADDATAAAFLEAEAQRGLAPASLALASAAIGAAARAAGAADPRGALTPRTLGRLKRKCADRGRGQVAGFRRGSVTEAATLAAAEGTLAGLRDAALLRLGSDGFLRISELAAVRVDDLEPGDGGSGRLALPRSKTDQEGRGETLYVCRVTMAAIADWRRAAGVASGPLFRPVSRDGSRVGETALSVGAVRSVICRRARAAGIEGRVSGHSLRVGAAQSLVAAGASTAELMQAGRWTDAATATRYAANELAGRGAVARYFEDEDA